MDAQSRARLANKVKILRGDLTHTEFGKILNVAGGSISHWENCRNIPSFENMEKLAELSRQLPEEFIAELYGRQIPSTPISSIEEQIKTFSVKRLISLMALIVSLLAGSVIIDEVPENKESQEKETTQIAQKSRSKKLKKQS